MGRASNGKRERREARRRGDDTGQRVDYSAPMRLRIQATVAHIFEPGYAKLVMEDVRAEHWPLIVLACGCPADLRVGETALFSGALQMRAEPSEGKIVPVLTVETVEPPSQISPWAHLDAPARLVDESRTYIAPLQDADATVTMATYTGVAAELPARDGRAPVHLLRCLHNRPGDDPGERDALTDLLLLARKGERVRVSGDLYLLGRGPDDAPGCDLYLQLSDLARVS